MQDLDEMDFQTELGQLREVLTHVDEHLKRSAMGGDFIEFLIMRTNELKLKMYQERGHGCPHIHVDYGRINHAASYAIDPPHCLEGGLRPVLDRFVIAWIVEHQETLLKLWRQAQAGESVSELLLELK